MKTLDQDILPVNSSGRDMNHQGFLGSIVVAKASVLTFLIILGRNTSSA
jgi:hypothetical protein